MQTQLLVCILALIHIQRAAYSHTHTHTHTNTHTDREREREKAITLYRKYSPVIYLHISWKMETKSQSRKHCNTDNI